LPFETQINNLQAASSCTGGNIIRLGNKACIGISKQNNEPKHPVGETTSPIYIYLWVLCQGNVALMLWGVPVGEPQNRWFSLGRNIKKQLDDVGVPAF